LIPSSESIVVVTSQNIKRRKAISAIEPALISGNVLLAMFLSYLKKRLTSVHAIAPNAIAPKRYESMIPPPPNSDSVVVTHHLLSKQN